MNDSNTATVRTTVNGTILTVIIIAVAAIFGWTIEVADLAPYLPVLAGAIAVFYRLSLVVSAKWPSLGYVLFGKAKAPTYSELPPPPPEFA
jgi:cobalamin biosynthesis protein CobD/CbiB